MQQMVWLLLLSSALVAQNSARHPAAGNQDLNPPASATAQPANQPPSAATVDELAQMRDDLNRLESLNLNMSSEIEFLRDQNLQILLRTNVQMWTVLIRDLRRQIDREEQRRVQAPPQPAPAPSPR